MQGTADFIAQDMRPVSMVDSTGFKNLIIILSPVYTVPARENTNAQNKCKERQI